MREPEAHPTTLRPVKQTSNGFEKSWHTVEGPFYDKGDSVLAVTGGIGEYADAEGEMALSAIGTDGKAYTFVYKLK